MTGGVYQIKCVPTGKIYVGSSSNIKKRWKEHRGHLNRKTHHAPHLQNAWNKHGAPAFEFAVLVVCDQDMLLVFEQIMLDALKPAFNTAPIAGSILGHRQSEAAKRNMSLAQRGWRKKYAWAGENLCLSDIAERENFDQKCLKSRVTSLGMSVEQALNMGPPEHVLHEYEGRSLSSAEWARELGIHTRRMAYWIKSGMTISDCVRRLTRVEKAISLRRFCIVSGVSDATVKSRLQRGIPLLDAFPELSRECE